MDPDPEEDKLSSTTQNVASSVFYCFSPYCKNHHKRVFSCSDSSDIDPECRKWIMSQHSLLQCEDIKAQYQKQLTPPNSIELKFQSEPIQSLLKMDTLKDIIEQEITNLYDSLLVQITKSIEANKKMALMKYTSQRQEIKPLIHQIDQIMKIQEQQTISFKIQEFLQRNIHLFQSLQDLQAFNKGKFMKYKKSINALLSQCTDSILSHTYVPGELQFVSEVQKEKVKKYLRANQPSQVTLISNLFAVPETKYLLKGLLNDSTIIKCPLCNFETISKVSMAQIIRQKWPHLTQLIDHLLTAHLQEITALYSTYISHKSIYQMTFQDLIYTMKNHNYEELLLFVNSNGQKFQPVPFNPKALVVQFSASKAEKNRHFKYLILQNTEEAIYFICILIYEIVIKEEKKVKVKAEGKAFSFFQKLTKIINSPLFSLQSILI